MILGRHDVRICLFGTVNLAVGPDIMMALTVIPRAKCKQCVPSAIQQKKGYLVYDKGLEPCNGIPRTSVPSTQGKIPVH